MLRISRLTDYGTVILARLAAAPHRQFTAAELARLTHVPAATVRKLLKQLHAHALVDSTRGLHGGYRLSRPAVQITAAQVLAALEGPVALTECAQHATSCGIEGSCGVGRAWQRVNVAIQHTLQEITLLELAGLAAEPIRFAALERQVRAPRSAVATPPGRRSSVP
jgi:FeS assembly SUF system regulator